MSSTLEIWGRAQEFTFYKASQTTYKRHYFFRNSRLESSWNCDPSLLDQKFPLPLSTRQQIEKLYQYYSYVYTYFIPLVNFIAHPSDYNLLVQMRASDINLIKKLTWGKSVLVKLQSLISALLLTHFIYFLLFVCSFMLRLQKTYTIILLNPPAAL